MKIKWSNALIAFFIGLLFLAGCYPSESLLTEEFDTIISVYDTEQDFSKFQTYAIPDTVIQIGDSTSSDYIDLELTQEEMDKIINQIRQNMAAYGYIEILPDSTGFLPQEPDVVIFVEALAQRRTQIWVLPPGGWWGGWWGWPGWGWGPGWGGWGPPVIGASSFSVGTLYVDYADVQNSVPGEDPPKIPVPWVGALNGLLVKPRNIDNRILPGIDQMFNQSPYLRTN